MSVREPAKKVKKSELRREAILQNALKIFDRVLVFEACREVLDA